MPHGRLAATLAVAFTLALPATALAGEDRFPRDFLWGVASAGFQSEMGGTPANVDRRTDWFRWTHDAANIAGTATRQYGFMVFSSLCCATFRNSS